MGVALGALRGWIAYTDPLKAAHSSAWIFTSSNLSRGNWGLFNLAPLFSREVWGYLLGCWGQAVMPRWMVGLGLVAGLAGPETRWRVLGTGGVFLLAQVLFPFAYAYQDYYFYACALFLNVAFGFWLLGVLDSRLPRWCCWLVLLVPFAAQVTTYWRGYRVQQAVFANGGYPFTDVLRDLTPPKSVIVVAGADWAAMTPLYAQRKALMIRNGLEFDQSYLKRAFDGLADEEVSALVLYGSLKTNRQFIQWAAERFDLDASAPTFSHETADIYVTRLYRKGVQLRLKHSGKYYNLTLPGVPTEELPTKGLIKISPATARSSFLNITPGPYKAEFQYGLAWMDHGMTSVLSAHPNSDLWLHPPAGATEIKWDFGIFPGAYEPEARTNGVEFIIFGEMPDGRSREVYRRLLDPRQNPSDRGDQHLVLPYSPLPEEVLRFSTRPNGDYSYDWAYWIDIEVK